MEKITAKHAAEKWGLSQRRVQDLCRLGKIPGAELFGRTWMIPAGAERPADGRRREAAGAERPAMPRRCPLLSMTDLYQCPGSADKTAGALHANSAARELFEAEIAYGQGRIDRACAGARHILEKENGFYAALGAGIVLAQCAVWRGDNGLWDEAQKLISRVPCRDEAELDIRSLAMTVVHSSVLDCKVYPDWFERGDFELLPPEAHPMAKVFYAHYLYMTGYAVAARQFELEGVHGLALMRLIPRSVEPMISQAVVDKTVIPEIHLRLWCAAAYHNSGQDPLAALHIDRAIAMAMPDRLYGILAVYWRQLDKLLEERLACVSEEAVKTTRKLHRIFTAGHVNLYSNIRQLTIVPNFTDREREVAKLITFGFTNKQAAQALGVSESTVKSIVQKIMQKTGLTDRSDFVLIL